MAFGCLIAGVLIQRYGRRMSHFILNFPFVLGWVILSISTNIWWIMLGRFITGLCVGLLGPTAPVYIGETTAPKYRGLFLAGITLAVSGGIIIVHTLGWFFSWQVTALICATCPFASYIIMAFVPESPVWLLAQGRIEEATDAFHWFRGYDDEAKNEFMSMVDAHKANTNTNANRGQSIYNWSKLKHSFSSRIFLLPLVTLLVFFATMQGGGLNAIIFYSVTILKQLLGDYLNEYVATLIIDIARLITSLVACIVIKKSGRRPLLMVSGIGTTVALLALALSVYLSNQYSESKNLTWIPLVILLMYIVMVSIGMNPLPWCMVGELFPAEHRALGSSIVTFFNFFCMFLTVKTSPFLFQFYGVTGAFSIYGIITLIGTAYLLVYLPETKNRTLQEIEDKYRGNQNSKNKVAPVTE